MCVCVCVCVCVYVCVCVCRARARALSSTTVTVSYNKLVSFQFSLTSEQNKCKEHMKFQHLFMHAKLVQNEYIYMTHVPYGMSRTVPKMAIAYHL